MEKVTRLVLLIVMDIWDRATILETRPECLPERWFLKGTRIALIKDFLSITLYVMASISSPSLILVRLIASMVRGDKIPVDGVQLKTIQQQNEC